MRNRHTHFYPQFRMSSLVGALAFTLMLVVGFVHLVWAKEGDPKDDYEKLRTFTDVMALVRKNYVEDVAVDDLIDGAIKGMLSSLDPHSGFLDTEMFTDLQVETKGEFGGLGIEITIKDGLLTVVAPIEGTPAFRAGVLAGDQIIKIEDEFTKNLSLSDAVKRMRGKRGTPITISVHREGEAELVPITIVRDIIHVQSVRYRMLEDGFGYIRLAQFQEESAKEFAAAIMSLREDAKDKKLFGLAIDLRNNPGGLLTQAIRVADLFLDEGVIVYTDGRLDSQKQKYYAHKGEDSYSFPVVVMINGGSASASEIVAGALQDHRRALILGTQSFGKGSVQTILPMDSGAALRLTTALYYTKSGRSIQAEGITPDIIVSARRFPKDSEELLEEDEEDRPRESALPGAIRNPTQSDGEEERGANAEKDDPLAIGSRSAMTADLKDLLEDDPQLDEALRLLKTWHIFQGEPVMEAKVSSPGKPA